MLGIGKRYRLVLRDDDGIRAWSPQTRSQAIAAFSARVASGDFAPWGGPQLMVLSEEEWERLGGSGDGDDLVRASVAAGTDGAAQPGSGGSRGFFRWLSRKS